VRFATLRTATEELPCEWSGLSSSNCFGVITRMDLSGCEATVGVLDRTSGHALIVLERDYHTALHDPTLTCHRCDVVASEVSFTAGRPARPRSAAVCPTFCRKTGCELREVDFTDRNSSKREPSDIRCPHPPSYFRPAKISFDNK
jgi:hypothetical protein